MFELKWKNIKIQLHFSFFAVLAFLTLFAGGAESLAVFALLILHEAGHLLALCCFHIAPERIQLSGLGMQIVLGPVPLSHMKSAMISLAGPIVNLLIAVICLFFGLNMTGMLSLIFGLFHILPIEPLDGGNALKSLLSRRFGIAKAGRISLVISLLLLFPMAVTGFYVLIQTRYNFTLLALSIFTMFYLLFRRGTLEIV